MLTTKKHITAPILLMLVFALVFALCSCDIARSAISGLIALSDRKYSTKSTPVSHDGKYKLVTEFEDGKKYVRVQTNDEDKTIIYTVPTSIYPSDVGYPIDVYWAVNSYDFFILSSDMGSCMVKYEDSGWISGFYPTIIKTTSGNLIAQIYTYEDSRGKVTYDYDINNLPKEIYDYILN